MKHLLNTLALLFFTVSAFGQPEKPTLITWAPDCSKNNVAERQAKPICDSVISDGLAIRSISYKGMLLAVSFVDDGNYVVADMFISNDTGERLLVDPSSWIIAHYKSEEDFRSSKNEIRRAFAVPPSKIAKKIMSRIRWANALSAFGAGMATTTSTGNVTGTVRDNQGNSGTYIGQTEVTSPDYTAQRRAAAANTQRSQSAAERADNIMSSALFPNTVFDKSKISGLVYFERSKKAKYGIVCLIINEVGYFFDWHVK